MTEESARIGRPPEFTTEQIVAAGKRIVARNQAVNGFRLRSELGGGKSSRLMEVWTRHENELIDAAAKRIDDLPFELAPHADSVAELASVEARTNIQKLYRAIYSEINGRLNAQFKKELERANDVAVKRHPDLRGKATPSVTRRRPTSGAAGAPTSRSERPPKAGGVSS